MKTIIERIKTQITQLEKEKKDYINTRKEEELIDNQSIDETELILQGENILDRKSTEKRELI